MPPRLIGAAPGRSWLPCPRGCVAVEALLKDATAVVRERVSLVVHPVDRLLDREQRATHGLAWLATYVETIRQLVNKTNERRRQRRIAPGARRRRCTGRAVAAGDLGEGSQLGAVGRQEALHERPVPRAGGVVTPGSAERSASESS